MQCKPEVEFEPNDLFEKPADQSGDMVKRVRAWWQLLLRGRLAYQGPAKLEAAEWALERGAVMEPRCVLRRADGYEEWDAVLVFQNDVDAVEWVLRFRGTY